MESKLVHNYYVYDVNVVDESVCVEQGRRELKRGTADKVMIHKHKHGTKCTTKCYEVKDA